MSKIKTLIIDDEPLARERVRDLLVADAEIEIGGEGTDGGEAVAAILEKKPDLIFLDVQMPELDGFGVIAEIGAENMPPVIFITVFDQYALRAFEVCALDYLLKPFDDERFQKTLERAKRQIQNSGHAEDLQRRLLALLETVKPPRDFLQKILVKANDRLSFLGTEKIDWIKAEGNYVRLHIREASHLLRETISNLETQLDPARFIRISRSAIVNINRVKEIQQMFHGDYRIILEDGTELNMSRRFRDRLPRLVTKS